MFHVNNDKVRSLLLSGNFGLEKESLRTTADGFFSKTYHPFEDDSHIVYDFCENQTEINTEPAQSAQEAADLLLKYTAKVQKTLATLPDRELLWPFSNPPFIRNENDIPIAGDNAKDKHTKKYREYLADRYGRYKMSLSGIHVNYSFSDELLKADFELSDHKDFREYKDQIYLGLAEGLSYFGWVITALTAASPVLDTSYFEKGKTGGTVFNGLASTRCSELGYWNHFTPVFDYSDIHAYTSVIQQYVDQELITAPRELYFPIRLKSYGKNDLGRLAAEGVSHIELRMVDLNPLELSGINVKDLQFAQLLIIWIACNRRISLSYRDQIQAIQNFKSAAHYDLKTVNIHTPCGYSNPVADEGLKIIQVMKKFFSDYPEDILDILTFEEEKFIDLEKRYAWKIRQEYADNYVEKGLLLAKEQQEALICL